MASHEKFNFHSIPLFIFLDKEVLLMPLKNTSKEKSHAFRPKPKTVWLTAFALLLIVLCTLLAIPLYEKYRNKWQLEIDFIKQAEEIPTDLFSIDKIILFSSADASQNEESKKALWNVTISQYTDVAIYLNNHAENGLSSRNTISSLSIGNISFDPKPTLGTPMLAYKPAQNFGSYQEPTSESCPSSLAYTLRNYGENIDYLQPEIYNDLSNPITFTYLNHHIKQDALITDTEEPLAFDGSLLRRANVNPKSIETTIHFTIELTTNMNETYVATVHLPLLFSDAEENTLYTGYQKQEISGENYLFYPKQIKK